MNIEVSDPELYFAIFYILAFAVSFVLIIFFTNRLKIPFRSVLLMLTTVSLCTIVGSRLTSIPFSEWSQVITTGKFEAYTGRFAVGGLLFGLAGLIFSEKVLGLGDQIYKLYAWVTPLGLGIQKIGCFLNGCCYGKPADLFCSVKYPVGTSAHFHQMADGLIVENAEFTLGVLPVQIFEAISLMTVSYVVWRSIKFWKNAGSSLIFSLMLFAIFRFSFEFLRAPSLPATDRITSPGLNNLQWMLLLAFILFIVLIIITERRPVRKTLQSEQPLKKSIMYVLTLSAVIYLCRNLFTHFELISLNIKFIPAILLVAGHTLISFKETRFQLATTSLFAVPLFLTTQALLPDSTAKNAVKNFNQNEIKSYKRIDAGASIGEYYGTVRYNPHEGDCGTAYTTEDYKYVYRIAGAGYSSVKKNDKSITTWGINLYGGSSKETNITKNSENSNFLFGVNPYIRYDLNWLGMGVGAHLGNIRWVPQNPIDANKFDQGTRFSPIMPDLYLRVGRRDIVDLQYTFGSGFPTIFPVLMHEVSIGSGFGFKTDYNFRLGQALSGNDGFAFISAEALIGKQFGLTFKYNFGGEEFYNSSNYEVIDRKGRFMAGMNYRFGFRE